MEFVAVNDTFGESGKVPDLIAKYGLDTQNVVDAVLKVLERKG
jgi:transketolase